MRGAKRKAVEVKSGQGERVEGGVKAGGAVVVGGATASVTRAGEKGGQGKDKRVRVGGARAAGLVG